MLEPTHHTLAHLLQWAKSNKFEALFNKYYLTLSHGNTHIDFTKVINQPGIYELCTKYSLQISPFLLANINDN